MAHAPNGWRREHRRYWFFQAAKEGCLHCVRHMLEGDASLGTATSETHNYTALDFALWSEQNGVPGAGDVVEFLTPVTAATELPQAPPEPPSECSPGTSHRPAAGRREQNKYWLFAAASARCVRCVQHWVEEVGVDPASTSDTQGWTAMLCAEWARREGVSGAAEVETYLAGLTAA